MPRKPAIERELTPEQKRVSEYLIDLELRWRLEKPIERSRITQVQIAEGISKFYPNNSGHSISPSGYGAWRNGKNTPDIESTEAIIAFFGADREKTYEAFGHQLPMTFTAFYALAKEKAKEEQWPDADELLSMLFYTIGPEWEDTSTDKHWTIELGWQVLNSRQTIYEKAKILSDVVDGYMFFHRRDKEKKAN